MTYYQALPSGTILGGDYRIVSTLGQGGFGLTYRAQHVRLDTTVAIKEYFPTEMAVRRGDTTVRARTQSDEPTLQWGMAKFLDEARTLGRLRHPNILRVSNYFEANNTAYMVVEFEEGVSVVKWLDDLGRAPTQRELDTLVAPLLDALATMHAAGVLHRDISPDNIILRPGLDPVLIDFGASRLALGARSRTVHAIVKPGYSPKEQYALDMNAQGPWSDIYATGATRYRCIAGRKPPDALSRDLGDPMAPAAVAAQASYRPEFLAGIDAALAIAPEARPRSIEEWRAMLLPASAAVSPPRDQPTAITRPAADLAQTIDQGGPPGSGRPAATGSGVTRYAAAAAFALLGAGAVWQLVSPRSPPARPAGEQTVTAAPAPARSTPAPPVQQPVSTQPVPRPPAKPPSTSLEDDDWTLPGQPAKQASPDATRSAARESRAPALPRPSLEDDDWLPPGQPAVRPPTPGPTQRQRPSPPAQDSEARGPAKEAEKDWGPWVFSRSENARPPGGASPAPATPAGRDGRPSAASAPDQTASSAPPQAGLVWSPPVPGGGPRFRRGGPDEVELGADRGYPHCDRATWFNLKSCQIGALSNMDRLYRIRSVLAPPAGAVSQLRRTASEPAISYRYGGETRSIEAFLDRHPVTSLVIARGDQILIERYQYDRKDSHLLTSFSMAKTVIGLLVGIAVRDGSIRSILDSAETYVPEIKGSEYGRTPIKSLLQMSSGVAFREVNDGNDDIRQLGRLIFGNDRRGAIGGITQFNTRVAEPGQRFSYSSAETVVLGLVLAAATKSSLSEYMQRHLWQPLGAEDDAQWSVDSRGQEAAYTHMHARARDWVRLGLMLAHVGHWNGRQIVPASWIADSTTLTAAESRLRPGTASRRLGYGYQVWLLPGTRGAFVAQGRYGQRLFVDPPSRTVMLHTAVRFGPRDTSIGDGELHELWHALVAGAP